MYYSKWCIILILVALPLAWTKPQIEESTKIDLSYLRGIYGSPSIEVGRIVDRYYKESNFELNPEELGGYAEGDILIPRSLAKNGVVKESYRWPHGLIPFEIRGTFSAKEMETIEKAIVTFHKYTCIKFIARRNTDKDYVSLQAGLTGCWSSIGRQGGPQIVNLQSPGCLVKIGTVIHELLHAVGFLHEQNREERDSFVAIQLQNVKPGAEVNFDKAPKGSAHGYGVGYDYGSIMHYSSNAFSSNGRDTLVPLKATKSKIGQRNDFSNSDVKKVWNMYNCQMPTASSGYKPNFANAIELVPNIISGFIDLLFPDASDMEEVKKSTTDNLDGNAIGLQTF